MLKGEVAHNRSHGMSLTPEYYMWCTMRRRCLDPKATGFIHYGGRGITVCKRWSKFENFLADMGPRPKGASIERVNNHLGYRPSNCMWATRRTQNRNKRNNINIRIGRRTQCLMDWCIHYGVSYSMVTNRVRRHNISWLEALTNPPAKGNKSNHPSGPRTKQRK